MTGEFTVLLGSRAITLRQHTRYSVDATPVAPNTCVSWLLSPVRWLLGAHVPWPAVTPARRIN